MTDCCVCGDPVSESGGFMGKFDDDQPMYIDGDDVCHLGCSDELFSETYAELDDE